jgi:hypothetical protein
MCVNDDEWSISIDKTFASLLYTIPFIFFFLPALAPISLLSNFLRMRIYRKNQHGLKNHFIAMLQIDFIPLPCQMTKLIWWYLTAALSLSYLSIPHLICVNSNTEVCHSIND